MIAYGMSREEVCDMMLPRRLEKLFRRLAMLERGHTYVLSLRLPERDGDCVELTILAQGRIEKAGRQHGQDASHDSADAR